MWGVGTSVALARMADATQHMGWGVGFCVIRSVALAHMAEAHYAPHAVGGGLGCDYIRCTCAHG